MFTVNAQVDEEKQGRKKKGRIFGYTLIREEDEEDALSKFKPPVQVQFQVAAGSYLKAQYRLGSIYLNGDKDIPENSKEAEKWLLKPALSGSQEAQNDIGCVYYNWATKNNKKYFIDAFAWWTIAVSKGNKDAKKNLKLIGKTMDPEQVAKGEKLTRELLLKIKNSHKENCPTSF